VPRTKQQRSKWFASLTPEQRAAYVDRKVAEKAARAARAPSRETQEASARLDLATERGCFMGAIPDADVQARLAQQHDVPLVAAEDKTADEGELDYLRFHGLWPVA
jgi:hypothetical protein